MADATTPLERISGNNPKGRSWTQSVTTRDGGVQTCRFIEDHTGVWVQVGRWAADAAASVKTTWSSVRGLSTSIAQNATTEFSADWGHTYPTECRFLGATNFNIYLETRTIDFIHGVPHGVPWKHFMANQPTHNASDTTVMQGTVTGASGGPKYGWTCRGAYDGFGRWSNPYYKYHKISDAGTALTHHTAAFSTATSNAFYWNAQSDAKVTVNGTGENYSGQDVIAQAGFGQDDSNNGFYDDFPAATTNMAGGSDYTSAVWVLIKFSNYLPGDDTP